MVIIRWKPSKQTCCCRKDFKIPIYNLRRLGEQLVWSNWESLGGVLYSGPDACSWGPGRLDIFAKVAAGNINHKWLDNGQWHDWESLGTPVGGQFSGIVTDPSAVSWGKDRVDIFVVARNETTQGLWRRHYDRLLPMPLSPTGFWNWEGLGGCSGYIDACSWGPGRLDIFAEVAPGNINHKWLDNGRWYDWEPLGAPPGVRLTLPTAASWGNGRIDIFAKGHPDNALWHKYADLYTF
jgi:hypothetical protein